MAQELGLRLVNLGNHRVADRTSWTLVALGIFTAVIKVWDSVRLGLHPGLALGISQLAGLALIAYRHARRRAGLCPATRRVYRLLLLYGWVLKRTELDVSGASSVKAQPAGRAGTQLAVELSVNGDFVELIRIPSIKGSGIAEAETVCARVARYLDIPNHGVLGAKH